LPGLATDDLVQQATLARRLAPELCAPTDCAWYHGVWPALRALGLVATPERNRPFFDRVLCHAAASGDHSRVLVSGAADDGMLAIVLAAFGAVGAEARPTVLDRCPMPLRLSEAYAGRAGVAIDTWVTDVFEARRPEAFDLICTHGLFPSVPPDRRRDLAQRWAHLLRPGGVVVTTSSLSSPSAPDTVHFAPEAVDGFAERTRAAAEAARDRFPVASPAELADAARTWAERARVHPVKTTDEMQDLLEEAGFSVELEVRELEGPVGKGAAGPWTARSARYAEVVATRRP
jgi:methyltransferase family protein